MNAYATAELPEEAVISSLEDTKKRESSGKKPAKKKSKGKEDDHFNHFNEMTKTVSSFYSSINEQINNEKKIEDYSSSKEKEIIYYQNLLIDAYEKMHTLKSDGAKRILQSQIENYENKLSKLNSE